MITSGTMRFVNLKLASPTFSNPRTSSGMDPVKMRELAKNIVRYGVLTPLLVTPDGVIVSGQRRYRAIELILFWHRNPESMPITDPGDDAEPIAEDAVTYQARKLLQDVPVRVMDLSPNAIEGVAMVDNIHREPLSSFEIANRLWVLHETGVSGTELARLTGKSSTWVSRKLSTWRGATPDLRIAWQNGNLTDDAIQQIAELPAAQQGDALLKALGGTMPRTGRGPAGRPGIETVKEVLSSGERAVRGSGQSEYARGILDALRWSTGTQSSADFAEFINSLEDKNADP